MQNLAGRVELYSNSEPGKAVAPHVYETYVYEGANVYV